MRSKELKRKKELQVRWLERYITPSYASNLGIDNQRIKSEDAPHRDHRVVRLAQPIEATTGQPKHEIKHANRAMLDVGHSVGHVSCGACELLRLSTLPVDIAVTKTFREAVETWLDLRSFNPSRRHRLIAPRTLKSYRAYAHALVLFFGSLSLEEIHIGNIREYQRMRSETAGPNKINQEVGLLVSIMKLSGAWTSELENFYEPFLHQESDIPRALTEAEQNHWLDVASSKERWKMVYCYSLVGFCTTASSNELRGIRLGDVNVRDAIVSIQAASAKNRHRIRPIPLNESGVWAMEWLLDRALGLGSTQPNHYLFPFRPCRNVWEPEKPMSDFGLFKVWNEVRDASGLAFPPNNVRHTAITRYAEAGTPIQVILSYAGHMSLKMQMHYTWISEQAKRKWQDRLTKRAPMPTGRFHAGFVAQK